MVSRVELVPPDENSANCTCITQISARLRLLAVCEPTAHYISDANRIFCYSIKTIIDGTTHVNLIALLHQLYSPGELVH